MTDQGRQNCNAQVFGWHGLCVKKNGDGVGALRFVNYKHKAKYGIFETHKPKSLGCEGAEVLERSTTFFVLRGNIVMWLITIILRFVFIVSLFN